MTAGTTRWPVLWPSRIRQMRCTAPAVLACVRGGSSGWPVRNLRCCRPTRHATGQRIACTQGNLPATRARWATGGLVAGSGRSSSRPPSPSSWGQTARDKTVGDTLHVRAVELGRAAGSRLHDSGRKGTLRADPVPAEHLRASAVADPRPSASPGHLRVCRGP